MIAYCDASALVKLVIAEPESEALITWLKRAETTATSALAVVEVHRAARVASPHDETARDAWGVRCGSSTTLGGDGNRISSGGVCPNPAGDG